VTAKFKVPFITGDRNTPLVFHNRDTCPYGDYKKAPFLPLVRFNEVKETWVTISAGKPVSLLIPNYPKDLNTMFMEPDKSVSSNVFIVPAGLYYQLKYLKENGLLDETTGGCGGRLDDLRQALEDIGGTKYTIIDVDEGVKNFLGQPVTAGEFVLESMINYFYATNRCTARPLVTITPPIGLNMYDMFMAGHDTIFDTATKKYMNFEPQERGAFARKAYIEIPVLSDQDFVEPYGGFILPGLTCLVTSSYDNIDDYAHNESNFKGKFFRPITIRSDSNFSFINADEKSDSDPELSFGRVLYYADIFEMPFNLTDYVKTVPNVNSIDEWAKVTSNATGGLDEALFLTRWAIGKAYIEVDFSTIKAEPVGI